jgi:hypothetical protein
MAVVNRNTLVLNNVSAVRGVVVRTVGMGFDSASGTAAAIPFSMRPSSHPCVQAGQRTSPRQDHADKSGAAPAADRAGRPDSFGAFASRSPAPPLATGGTCPTAAWRFGRFTAKHPASVGNVLPERLLASRFGNGDPWRLPCEPDERSHPKAGLAGVKPAGEALLTSARGLDFRFSIVCF